MASSFERITRALKHDSGRHSAAFLTGAAVLLGAWIVWAVEARITRYEISDSARLEVNASAYPVQSNFAGRLIRSGMVLGRPVQAGEVLAELDSDDQQLRLEQERTHGAGLQPQIAALRAQIATENAGGAEEHQANTFSAETARAQLADAESQAHLAADEAERAQKLHAAGMLSDADSERALAAARSKQTTVETLRGAVARLAPEQHVRERDRELRRKQMEADIARLEAEAATSAAAARLLENSIGSRRILAPVSGRLAECASLRPGAHIVEGQQLGVILPEGKLQVVAEFAPAAAFGKVRAGQPAALRLEGFPWAQYGTVPARVSRVADEIREGKVRVELAVLRSAPGRIPFQHGLPGSVEVEVERVSPAALVLRSAGEWMGAR